MDTNELQSSDLIAEWSRVTGLVAEIRSLIGTMGAAEVDSTREDDSLGGKEVAERVAKLAAQLRSIFADEESHGFIADLFQTAPQLSDGISQLRDERTRLLGSLDDVGQLAQMPLRSTASWKDVEHRFQRFMDLLADHERSEDLLIQRAALEDAGVID